MLECDDSPPATVVPEIEKLAEFLQDQGTELGKALETIYEDGAMNIKIHAFEKCDWIFQLAYVLTPAGQADARHQH
jgi:hypothetical protein